MSSATVKTKSLFESLGYHVETVERWIPGIGIRKDYLTCIDLHLIRPGSKTIIGVQVFTTAWAEHHRKICKEYPEGTRLWLGTGHKLIFVGWRKLKVKRGGKAVKWVPRFGELYLTKKGKIKLIERATIKEVKCILTK